MDITCMMKTYLRPRIAEEAIQCFLDQRFDGESELIIVNDYPAQRLVFNHPRVKVFNFNKCFPSVGDSFDWGFHQGTGKYIVPWEDDDLYLPHSLQERFDGIIQNDADYYKRPNAFLLNRGQVQEHSTNLFFCAGIWSRELYLKTTGCDHADGLSDVRLEANLKAACSPDRYFIEPATDINRTYYCYFWAGRGSHLSGFGTENEKASVKKSCDMLKSQCNETGIVTLKPHHSMDYYGNVRRFIEAQQTA